MGYKYNPLIFSGLDLVGSGSALTIGTPIGGADANAILTTDGSSKLSDVVLTDGQLLIGSTGNPPSANPLTGTSNQVIVTNHPGNIVLSLPQGIATGSDVTFHGLTLSVALSPTSGGIGLFGTTATAGQLMIGNGSGFTVATITGTANQVSVANGAGSITLSLPQSIATTSSPTFANLNLSPSGVLDITSTGTLAIGTTNANIINIGNSGATINIQGTTLYENVTQLQVTDPLITINKGGGTGSASHSGIEIEENAVITAYAATSSDRLSWQFLAPATAGIVTVTPGSAGFTLNQGSHNPVTIGTANGLSLSTQVLSLAAATTSTTGALTSTDWNTFNGKANATLNNLGTTAINADLLPASNNTLHLGNGSFEWASVSADHIFSPNQQSLQLSTGQFFDSSGAIQTTTTTAGVAFNQLTANTVPYLNASKLLTSSSVTPTTLGFLDATSSIQTQLNSKAIAVTGDISPTSFTGLANNTGNQTVTGFVFASTISTFDALVNIQISATTNTFTTVALTGTRRAGTWATNTLTTTFSGDTITGLAFSINSSGQILVTIGNITGFTAGTVKFRAITLS